MKGRESGMPEEVCWQSFYDADCIVEKLECAKNNRESIAEFGSGYGTFTFPACRGNFPAECWVWPAASALGDRSTFMSARKQQTRRTDVTTSKKDNSTYAINKYHEKTLPLAGDRRLWFNTHPQPSGCSCTGPKAIQVQPGTSFRSHRSLPAERGGNRHRFSEGGRSRCGYAGFACRGSAAQYDLCGLPDQNAGASLRRGSVYRRLHHQCGGQRACPRGCHHR